MRLTDGAGGSLRAGHPPTAETIYFASFNIRDNGCLPPNGQGFAVIRTWQNEGTPPTTPIFRISFFNNAASSASQRVLYALAWQDNGLTVPVGSETFASPPGNTPRFTYEWKAATAPGANNGYLKTYKNAILRKTIANIDNDTQSIGVIRMGGMGKHGRDGRCSLDFDAFVSTRTPQF
ncbi:MAG: hypothetical protein R2862_02560 [Thermoanaerobaculia bacterium]